MLRQKPFAVNLAKMLKKQPLGLLNYYVCIKGWGGRGEGRPRKKRIKADRGRGKLPRQSICILKDFDDLQFQL